MKKIIYLSILFMAFGLVACNQTSQKNYKKILDEQIETIMLPNNIQTDFINLPSKIYDDKIDITWISSNELIIDNFGNVNRPSHNDGDERVILTATLTYEGKIAEKKFVITVKALPDNSQLVNDVLEEKIDELTFPEQTVEDLELPISIQTSIGEISIKWTSSNPMLLSEGGKVTRPKFEDGNATIELTGVFTLKQVTKNKKYTIKIIAFEDEFTIGVGYDQHQTITHDYINQTMSQLPKYKYDGEVVDFMNGWQYSGLFNKEGIQYTFSEANKVTGKTWNVLEEGAQANDNTFDNTPIVNEIIVKMVAGDEIYFPEGKYYFSTQLAGNSFYRPNIHIAKDDLNIRGDGTNKTILVSKNSPINNKSFPTTTILISNAQNVKISDLSFSVDFNDDNLPEPKRTDINNPKNGKYDAPKYHIAVYGDIKKTGKVVMDNLFIEYFQVDGIRIHNSAENQILNSKIQKATDIGGNGHGYGIEIRGNGTGQFQHIDTYRDTYFNVVANVEITCEFIRHGIILSYMAHNNFIFNNTVKYTGDDGIDLHGQDEFLNYIYNNISSHSNSGAGIGLGNYGNSSNKHDESGVGNVLYKNVLDNNRYGITIQYETFHTQVLNNVIRNNRDGAIVEHLEVKFTKISDNILINNENKRVKNPRPKEW